MYAENEAIVHSMNPGEAVYVRERIQSQTHKNPGILQDDGTVFLIHLEETPRNVEPKEVFDIVSECNDKCGLAALSRSMSRASIISRSSTNTGTQNSYPAQRSSKLRNGPSKEEQDIDQITLQKYWNSLMWGQNAPSDWTKRSLAIADKTNKQGKHFGLMRNIYANLSSHRHNEAYVIYIVNQMTSCDHIAQTTIDTFEKEANRTIIRTKNQKTIQDAVDELFLGITGQCMASLGLQAHRVKWDLLTSPPSWRAGEAETKFQRELEVVDQNMAVIPQSQATLLLQNTS